MVDSIKAGYDIGDETDQRAAEVRRREIMEQIRQLEQEKAKCQGIKIALGGMRERLKGVIFQINSQKAEKLEVDTQRFSGAAADAVDMGIINVQAVMEKRKRSFSDVVSTTETQIGLLDSYISELAERIGTLKAGL